MSLGEQLRATLPDIPRRVETRALLAQSEHCVQKHDDGWLVRNDAPETELAVVVGTPAVEHILSFVTDRPKRAVLTPHEYGEHVASALEGWRREPAWIYELPTLDLLPAPSESVRLLSVEDSLSHLERGMRVRLQRDVTAKEIHAEFVDKTPASFAYAHWETETLYDISISTAAAYRQRGLAGTAISALIRSKKAQGKSPVWGAMESNIASQRLAEKLGFRKCDELAVFVSPGLLAAEGAA